MRISIYALSFAFLLSDARLHICSFAHIRILETIVSRRLLSRRFVVRQKVLEIVNIARADHHNRGVTFRLIFDEIYR